VHIPDGFLNTATVATTYAVSSGAIAYSLRRSNKKMDEKHVPLLGMMGAFIFAAQMLNFPVAGGTSGHLIGAALAAILLGPWAASLTMSCVLIVQCLIFQDGGLITLGANIFNMGIVASFTGYYLYYGTVRLLGESNKSRVAGGFIAAWVSVLFASVFTAIELAVSGIVPWGVALPAMAGVHALIGIGEGAITVAVLSFVWATRRDLLGLQKI
jgi:cobalt/nickel transport system permease protein